jgi:hypothetical protein
LYETTRFTAARFLRSKARQQAREQEAYVQSSLNDPNPDSVWRQLAPLLEEAVTRLNEKERALLALRFFENKSGVEAADLLGMQEWAARKRTARALEKLQQFFLIRGIVSTTEAIAGAISAHSVQAAPVALAKSVTAAAIAKGATASGSTLTFINGALKIMAWSKAKTAIITGLAVLLAAGASTVTIKEIQKHRHESQPQQRIIRIAPNGSMRVVTPGELSQSGQSHGGVAFRSSFKFGSDRDAIVRQLEQMHATILNDSPELLRAKFEKTPQMKKEPPQVDLNFTNGKLTKVTYILSQTNAPGSHLGGPQNLNGI